MSKRPPNELESRLHKAILSTPKTEMTAKDTEAIIPDPSAREKSLNFLLGVGLLKTLVDANRKVSFRAVTKGELVVTKDLNGEENLVFSHIKAAGNEGIWTKHLKTKTNLHQTVIDRCLKTLAQKRLVKRVPSVQHPTRKIYMLEGMEPSISLTGGPWYTDNELDTEFIQHLTDACYKFIRDLTFPKRKNGTEDALYGPSNPPNYPTAQHIRNSLKKARLTETELSVEHVEMLLNVLVLDRKIERLPVSGISMWDPLAADETDSAVEDKKRKKRKRGLKDPDEDEKRAKRKKKRKDLGVDNSSSSEEDSKRKLNLKKAKKKKNDENNESESEAESKKKRRKMKKAGFDTNSSDESSDEEPKRKKSKKSRLSDSTESTSDDEEASHRNAKASKALKRPTSTFEWELYDDLGGGGGGGCVYRAIKEEQTSLGWSEAPCSFCPSFDFCKDNGPVNPIDCIYYGEWFTAHSLSTMDGQA